MWVCAGSAVSFTNKPWAKMFFNFADPQFPYLKIGDNTLYLGERMGWDDVSKALVQFLEHRKCSVNISFCCQNQFSAPTIVFPPSLPLCMLFLLPQVPFLPYPGELLRILQESSQWSSTLWCFPWSSKVRLVAFTSVSCCIFCYFP